MKNPFSTKRLSINPIRDIPEDQAIVDSILGGPHTYALSNLALLRPGPINDWKTHFDENYTLAFIIRVSPPPARYTESGIPIGVISLSKIRPVGHEQHRASSININILEEHRGHGYSSEAIEWLLHWGFGDELHRIGFECFSYNVGIVKMVEQLGFVLEGRKRDAVWNQGAWHDWLIYSLLEPEWKLKRREAGDVS
ncbi:hypothetical protein GTA08_BOTSDO07719 [Botryosphaeria dothidea]|uniref:N-acetyltransferase domain-containing protein n=1 Tax=Botryosphaeria dothidea TaxID=55169 RepID=A0A8H4INW0_9PEZI|nr:hypothetical protein GTA08_BOTSDO07719 [Botryosphaeria dothidea]